jgi:hypothetical protein
MTMPWRVFQDYAHHVETPPERIIAPWYLYGRDVTIPAGLEKGWLPEHIVPLLEQQVWNEYQGDPPPVDPKPIPEPQIEPLPEPGDGREN